MKHGECYQHENLHHARPGDPIELGICMGSGVEPTMRWGRPVGVRHDDCREFERFIVREYKESDGYFPTGDYYTTSQHFLTPHKLNS